MIAFAYPPYQFDAATPGTLVARSAFFGQHGYVPDVQDLADDVNTRATFIAGGKGIRPGTVKAGSSLCSTGTVLYPMTKRGVSNFEGN